MRETLGTIEKISSTVNIYFWWFFLLQHVVDWNFHFFFQKIKENVFQFSFRTQSRMQTCLPCGDISPHGFDCEFLIFDMETLTTPIPNFEFSTFISKFRA